MANVWNYDPESPRPSDFPDQIYGMSQIGDGISRLDINPMSCNAFLMGSQQEARQRIFTSPSKSFTNAPLDRLSPLSRERTVSRGHQYHVEEEEYERPRMGKRHSASGPPNPFMSPPPRSSPRNPDVPNPQEQEKDNEKEQEQEQEQEEAKNPPISPPRSFNEFRRARPSAPPRSHFHRVSKVPVHANPDSNPLPSPVVAPSQPVDGSELNGKLSQAELLSELKQDKALVNERVNAHCKNIVDGIKSTADKIANSSQAIATSGDATDRACLEQLSAQFSAQNTQLSAQNSEMTQSRLKRTDAWSKGLAHQNDATGAHLVALSKSLLDFENENSRRYSEVVLAMVNANASLAAPEPMDVDE